MKQYLNYIIVEQSVPRINKKLADMFLRMSKLEPDRFRRQAYGKAGIAILNLDKSVKQIKNLKSIEGIGQSTINKINEYIETGRIKKLDLLEATQTKEERKRFPRQVALRKIKRLLLEADMASLKYEIAGSIRRKVGATKDVDILMLTSQMNRWKQILDDIKVKYVTKGSQQVDFFINGIEVNLRGVKADEWGAGLVFFTGSKSFGVNLRRKAAQKGMLLNRYGLFDRKTNIKIAGRTEKGIFDALKEKYIAPERRG